jgi:hypothetical protein
MSRDDIQDVIEIVSYSSDECPQRFESLQLKQLFFRPLFTAFVRSVDAEKISISSGAGFAVDVFIHMDTFNFGECAFRSLLVRPFVFADDFSHRAF